MGLEKAQFKQKAEDYFNNRGLFAGYTVQSAWLRYFLNSSEFQSYSENMVINFSLIAGWIQSKLEENKLPSILIKNKKLIEDLQSKNTLEKIFDKEYRGKINNLRSSANFFETIGMSKFFLEYGTIILWKPSLTYQIWSSALPLSQRISLAVNNKVTEYALTYEDAERIFKLSSSSYFLSEKKLNFIREELIETLKKEETQGVLARNMIQAAYQLLFSSIEEGVQKSKDKYQKIISLKTDLSSLSLTEIIKKITDIFEIDILKASEAQLKQAFKNVKYLISPEYTLANIDDKAFCFLPELEKQCEIAIKAKKLLDLGSCPSVGNHGKKTEQLKWANNFLDIIFRSQHSSYGQWIENFRRKPYADLLQNLTNAYSIKSDYDALEKYDFEGEFTKLLDEETVLSQTLNELNPEGELYSNKLRDFLSRTECCLLKYVDFLKKIGEADAYDLKVPNKFQDDIVRLKHREPDTKKSEKIIGIVESRINACESLKGKIVDRIEEDEISKALANMKERFLDRANKLSSNSLSGDKINIENLILALEEFEKFEEETKNFVENKVGTIRIVCDDLRVEWTNRILPQKNRTFTTLEGLLNDPGECQKYDPNKFQEFKERIGKLNDQRKDYLLRLIQEKIDPPQSSSNQEIQDFLKIAIERYNGFKHKKAKQRQYITAQAHQFLLSALTLSNAENLKIQYGFLLFAIDQTQEDHNNKFFSFCCCPLFRRKSKLVSSFEDASKKYIEIGITKDQGKKAYADYCANLSEQNARPSTP